MEDLPAYPKTPTSHASAILHLPRPARQKYLKAAVSCKGFEVYGKSWACRPAEDIAWEAGLACASRSLQRESAHKNSAWFSHAGKRSLNLKKTEVLRFKKR